MSQNQDQNQEVFDEIDLKEYLLVILKWKWLIAVITILAVLTSGILSFFVLPPVYETKTVLMATNATDKQRYLPKDDGDLEGLMDTLSRLPEMTINTYVGQLKNDVILGKVIDRLELEKEGYSINSLNQMISVSVVKDTNLIEIKVTNTEPATAALIANTLSEEFLNFISEKNKERMSQSVKVLKEQIQSIDKELVESNKKLQEFEKHARGIVFVEGELQSALTDLTTHQSLLIQTNIEVDQALAGKGQLEASLANTEKTLVKETKEKQPAEGIEEGKTVSTITEEPNPGYHTLLAQLETKKQEVAEKQAKAASISSAVTGLEERVSKLQTELTGKKNEYNKIIRNKERLEKSYDLFSERLAQTQIFQSIDIGESSIVVVAPALDPTSPVKPNKLLNIAIALVLGLMVSIFLAFILEMFDNNIKNADDVYKHLDLPVMGNIPKMGTEVKKGRA